MSIFKKKKIEIDRNNIPRHIGVILDGNGRWAKKRGLPRSLGHRAGADTLKKISEYCAAIGVGCMTAYVFSTENWSRPKDEVDYLMKLLYEYLSDAQRALAGKKTQIKVIGNLDMLNDELRAKIVEVEEMTADREGMRLNLAISYGGRDEIRSAVKKIARDVAAGKLSAEDITEEIISQNMFTAPFPDPDIIIRPSGEQRLSNFMLWQAAYAEFWYDDICWPDFSERDVDRVILDYQKRSRRYGNI